MKKLLLILSLAITSLAHAQIQITSPTKALGLDTTNLQYWKDFMIFRAHNDTVYIDHDTPVKYIKFRGAEYRLVEDDLLFNYKPFADAGPDTTITGSTVYLRGRSSDKDGQIVKHQWSLLPGYPSSAVYIAQPNQASTSGLQLLKGVYYFLYTATDNNNTSASAIKKVTKL